jgi:hypothetical protein
MMLPIDRERLDSGTQLARWPQLICYYSFSVV